MKESELKYVGHAAQRIDGLEKITGVAKYVDDIDLGPGTLYVSVLRSEYAHAVIKKIDTSKAEQLEGVLCCCYWERLSF